MVGGGVAAQGGGGGAEPFLDWNAEGYASTTELREDGDTFFLAEDVNLARTTLESVTGPAGSGLTKAMRHSYIDTDNTSDMTIGRNIRYTGVTELWLENFIMFSSNWTTSGPAGGNPDHKTCTCHIQPDGAGRVEYKIGVSGSSVRIGGPGDGAGGGGSENEFSFTGVSAVTEDDDPGNGVIWDGTWTGIRCHWKIDPSGGNAGIYQMWLNLDNAGWVEGVNETGLNTDSNLGVTTSIDAWRFCANLNKGSARNMYVQIASCKLYSSDPGW